MEIFRDQIGRLVFATTEEYSTINTLSKTKSGVIGLLLFLFSGIYFAARIPLANESLYFEEGIFAELIVHRPAGPLYGLGGRINGENIYGPISHPAVSYELLRLGGWVGQDFLNDPVYLDDTVVTPRLRILSCIYQFVIWAATAIILFFSRSIRSPWKYVILFTAAFSPLAMKTSVLLQIDNTAGAVFCGTAAILIFLAATTDRAGFGRPGLLFAAGITAGLGKQEWSMALLSAMAIVLVLQWMMKSKSQMYDGFVILAGLMTGNGISYLFDSLNYMAAFRFMALFSGLSSHSPQPWQLERWWSLVKIEAPFIYICFVLQTIFILSAIVNRKQNILKYLLFLYGTILFFTYLMINWNYEFRYFVPSLVVLTLACIAVLPASPPPWFNKIVGLLAVTVILSAVPFLLFYTPNKNTALERIKSGSLNTSENTVLFIDSGAGWNKPQIDYMNNNQDYEPVRQAIADKYGKKLVLP
jgi:hypothetical protein